MPVLRAQAVKGDDCDFGLQTELGPGGGKVMKLCVMRTVQYEKNTEQIMACDSLDFERCPLVFKHKDGIDLHVHVIDMLLSGEYDLFMGRARCLRREAASNDQRRSKKDERSSKMIGKKKHENSMWIQVNSACWMCRETG